MMQCVHETASSSHRKSRNGAITFIRFNSISLLNERHEFLEKEIFILPLAPDVIKIAALTGIRIRHYDDHGSCITFPDCFICYS
jgi:hypothetical protein